jgi:hypothetical protein
MLGLFDAAEETPEQIAQLASLAVSFRKLSREFCRNYATANSLIAQRRETDWVLPVKAGRLLFKAADWQLFGINRQPWDVRDLILDQILEMTQSQRQRLEGVNGPDLQPDDTNSQDLSESFVATADVGCVSPTSPPASATVDGRLVGFWGFYKRKLLDDIEKEIDEIEREAIASRDLSTETGQRQFQFNAVAAWLLFVRCEVVFRCCDAFRCDWPSAVVLITNAVAQFEPAVNEYVDRRTAPHGNLKLSGKSPDERGQLRIKISADVQSEACRILSNEAELACERFRVSSAGTHRLLAHESDPLPASPIGFLGGAELADALGVHATRRSAFFQQLTRKRKQLGDECWDEVSNPRANSPQFLYRVDSPKIHDLAAGYKTTKPA